MSDSVYFVFSPVHESWKRLRDINSKWFMSYTCWCTKRRCMLASMEVSLGWIEFKRWKKRWTSFLSNFMWEEWEETARKFIRKCSFDLSNSKRLSLSNENQNVQPTCLKWQINALSSRFISRIIYASTSVKQTSAHAPSAQWNFNISPSLNSLRKTSGWKQL